METRKRRCFLPKIKTSGNYWPASEKPSGWHYAGGPIVVCNVMLAGYVTCGCIYRTRRAAKAQAIMCKNAVWPEVLLFDNAKYIVTEVKARAEFLIK